MRKGLFSLICAALLLSSISASADYFSPDILKIEMPKVIHYYFDGNQIHIPYTLRGTATRGVLLIFTYNNGTGIKKVENGHLGWHYVNQIDTCLYVSNPFSLTTGNNYMSWDGKDGKGNLLPGSFYTFYILAFDDVSPGVNVTNFIDARRFAGSRIVTKDGSGQPLPNPVIFDALLSSSSEPVEVVRNKWKIGDNPADVMFLESTRYTSTGEAPSLALDPKDMNSFFTQTIMPNEVVLRKWKWAPQSEAVPQNDWGNNGKVSFPSSEFPYRPPFGGPVSDGTDQLFFPYLWPKDGNGIPNIDSGVAAININDGTLIRKIDLSAWWSSPPEAVYRPGFLGFSNGMLYVTSPQSSLVQMIDPYTENESYLVRWMNGYGDGIWDKSLPPGAPEMTWAFFGSTSPPNPASLSPDSNGFSLFPATGLGDASYGLFAPDGTGFGYYPIPGMADGKVYGLHVVHSGSAYDGIYYSGVASNGDSAGVWYRGYDSVKGIIMPGADMYWSYIRVLDPSEGDILESGKKWNITWESYGVNTIRFEFSPDGGLHWTTIADKIPAETRYYPWTVPEINSTNCLIRIGFGFPPSGRFTIVSLSKISEESKDVLLSFVTASNRPNPFNPSTSIHYELGMPGKVSISVYNILGQQVNRFDLRQKEKGVHDFLFNGSKLTSGIYFYSVETEYAQAAGKMLLVK